MDDRSEFLSFVLERRIRAFLSEKPFGYFMIEKISRGGREYFTWKYRYKSNGGGGKREDEVIIDKKK